MRTNLHLIAKMHMALTLEEHEDVRPVLWLYEHFLRKSLELPFKNPVHEFWGEGGASTEVMMNAFGEGEAYVYFMDDYCAGEYAIGLTNTIEWMPRFFHLEKLANLFKDWDYDNVDDFDAIADTFFYLIGEACCADTLIEAQKITAESF